MFNPDRLKTGRRLQQLMDKGDNAVKIKVQQLSTQIRAELGIKGALPEKARWAVYHAAQLMEKTGNDDVRYTVNTWYRAYPEAGRYVYSDKASKFYFWLRDEQLEEEDSLVLEAYLLIAREFVGKLSLPAKSFKNKGLALLLKLNDWLTAECGNELADVLIDYLRAVFSEMKKFKPALIQNPASALGDYGFSVFIGWIDTNYGGRKGYLLPTKEELKLARKQKQTLSVLTELRQEALLAGRIDLYDQLGQCGIDHDKIKSALIQLGAVA